MARTCLSWHASWRLHHGRSRFPADMPLSFCPTQHTFTTALTPTGCFDVPHRHHVAASSPDALREAQTHRSARRLAHLRQQRQATAQRGHLLQTPDKTRRQAFRLWSIDTISRTPLPPRPRLSRKVKARLHRAPRRNRAIHTLQRTRHTNTTTSASGTHTAPKTTRYPRRLRRAPIQHHHHHPTHAPLPAL